MKPGPEGFQPVEPPDLPPQVVLPEHYTDVILDPAVILPALDVHLPPPDENAQPAVDVWQTGLLEEVLHTQMLADASWKESTRMSLQALRADYREYGNRAIAASRIGGIVLTQGLDRSRLPFILIPGAITRTYTETNSAAAAGAAGFAAFTLWSKMVGGTLARNMEHLPKTVNTFTKVFPGFTSFFTENLPGLEPAEKPQKLERNPEHGWVRHNAARTKNFGKQILKSANTHFRRGMTGIGLGSTAYVASTIANGKGKKEALRAGNRLTFDTAAIIGSLGVGITLGLEKLAENGHPDTAKWIDDWFVSNNKFWSAVGLGSIYLNYHLNKKAWESDAPRMLLPKIVRPSKQQA